MSLFLCFGAVLLWNQQVLESPFKLTLIKFSDDTMQMQFSPNILCVEGCAFLRNDSISVAISSDTWLHFQSMSCKQELRRADEEFPRVFSPRQLEKTEDLVIWCGGGKWGLKLEPWSSLASFKPSCCFVSDRFITLSFSTVQGSVWRLGWSKQKRYITLEPISIAYKALNRLIYCIWDLGKWLNFYASLIPQGSFSVSDPLYPQSKPHIFDFLL